MKYTSVAMTVALIGTICHLCMVYIFVEILNWGFDGIAIATSAHFFIRLLVAQFLLKRIEKL